jgi:tetratricopeptide (TPR) repeat protein
MQAAAPIRLRMIGMLRRYGKTVSKLEEWEELEVRIGTLFGLNARHSEALKTYLALARDKRLAPEKKIKYLGMAIDAQRAVASWVDPSPFVMAKKVFPDEVRPELEALRGLYQEYFKKTGGFSALDWKVLAHLGALNFVMSQEDAAAKQWLAGVKKDSRTEEAAAALGLLINHRLKAKDWDKLEEAARAAVVAGVAAQDMGKAVDARGALSIALWNGGQDDFRNKNYASCARRMKELIEKFAEHPQRDQAMALRHMALRKQGQHEEALAALVSLVDTYPESRVTGSMLGHGASYALDLAREDLAVRFYDLLLGSDETSAPAIVAREALIELYLATGQRQSAARELIALIATPHLTEDRVVFWGRQLVLLQEGLEGNGGALRAAEQVKQLVPTNPVAKALFYQQQLRFARSESKLDRLVELERAIDGEADRSRELGSVLAEARFSIAVSKGRRLAQDLKAPSGNNPMPAVKRQGEAVEKLRQNFTDVCVAARSRYCAEGQYEMIKVLRAVAEHYSGVELPEGTFDPETVREFRIRRDRILTDVGRWRDEGLKLVRQEVAKGSADPLWVKTTYINDRLLNRTPWLAGMGPSWYLQVGKSRSQASPPEAGEKVAH